VHSAQKQKSKTQRLADSAAKWLTYTALTLGFGSFFIWLSLGQNVSFALERMVTVMVICCPHALGLAVPLVVSISTSISAKNGLLIRNRTAFENARKISTIVFDKTGTLTEGSHRVSKIEVFDDQYTENDVLQYAMSAEIASEHHISKGLQTKLSSLGLPSLGMEKFEYEPGVGVEAVVTGRQVGIGGYPYLEKHGFDFPEGVVNSVETRIFVVINNVLVGSIYFSDQIRASSYDAINKLKQSGINCLLLTGDNHSVAKHVADELDLNTFFAEVLPEQKQEYVKDLQNNGEFVAMTGDGINDAPALAQADIGIAIGSGTDVAAETADIILVNSDPKDIENLIRFGRLTYRKMAQNIGWATGYNLIALPLATGFIPGMIISPAFGAALMGVSTVVCAVNAQLLRKSIG
jgi:Cu2+-exporting ATPase